MTTSEEKRRHPRKEARWSVTIQTSLGAINTETSDISVNGAFIRCFRPLRLNKAFKVFISVPALPHSVMVDAEIVWASVYERDYASTPRGMGVQFTQISDHDRSLINSLISTS